MVRRLLLGLLKGILVGGAVGALLTFALGAGRMAPGFLNYLLYGGVAALAVLFAGQPPWREGAWVASILKSLFGFGIGVGLYWLGQRFLAFPVGTLGNLLPAGTTFSQAPLLFGPAVATAYGTLVELDDGGEAPPRKEGSGVRVATRDVDDIDIGEDSEKPAARSEQAKR